MHRIRSGIVGFILAAFLGGCGETTLDEGPKGFTPTDVKPLDPLADQMKKVVKNQEYNKRAEPPAEKGKTKEAEKKK